MGHEKWVAMCAFFVAPGVLAGGGTPPRPAVVAYAFPQDGPLDAAALPATRISHVNYAFANARDGRVVEGFAHDAENFKMLAALRRAHPHLKVLVSVGGWTSAGTASAG